MDAHEEQKRQQQAVEERLAELRAHGTPVSATTFQAWREKFQSEKHQLHSARLEPASKDKGPTGKAFFLAQELAGVQVCITHVTFPASFGLQIPAARM